MDDKIQTRKSLRPAETVAILLALLSLVAWYIPDQSFHNCMRAQTSDCSITQDNLINHIWGWTFLFSWWGALLSASIAIAGALLSRKKRQFLLWTTGILTVSGLAILDALIYIPRWTAKAFPGNTINWRHDQAMEAIWMKIWAALIVLFIMAVAAIITSGFLIYRPKITYRPRLVIVLRMIALIVLVAIWGYIVTSSPANNVQL